MPNITITEKDYTAAGLGAYENFAVVVPGFISTNANTDVFDDNKVYECHSQKEFLENVGQVSGIISGSTAPIHYGNQIAYELLGLGYTVLYLNMGQSGSARIAATIEKDEFWEPLKDRAAYDYRYILTGLLEGNTKANNCISKLAKGAENGGNRGDCVALVDIDEAAYNNSNVKTQAAAITAIRTEINKLTEADKYTAIFAPSVCYILDSKRTEPYAGNNKFPASFHYLACARTASLNNYAEWYAVAGYTRGTTSSFVIESTEFKFGEAAVNALAPRFDNGTKKAVNIIAKIRTNYYIWGNRTAHPLGTENNEDGDLVASHFLNIRQLCTTLKKQTYIACKRFTFDPNSSTLWINFKNAIEPTLERMRADQGIEDYRLIRNTADQKATFKARIRIIPIEAVEDFDIEISLEDSFGGTTASIVEAE